MMSEHLAGMNEKLALQKDQIDELTVQLSLAKVSKNVSPSVGSFLYSIWDKFY